MRNKFLLVPILMAVGGNVWGASDLEVLRTNTQNALNEQLKYSNQISKRATMNTNNITLLSGRVTTNTNDISALKANKLDKSVFVADQARQDKALANETVARIEGDKRNDAALAGKVDNAVYEGDQVSINNAMAGKVDKTDYANDLQDQQQIIRNEADKRSEGDAVLAEGLSGKVDSAVYTQDKADAYAAVAGAQRGADQANSAAQKNSADIADLRSSTNAGFKALRDQVDGVKKRADAGTAGVAAMAAIPGLSNGQRFNVGAGVGFRGDQQAVSVGATAAVNSNVTVRAAVAADTNSGFTAGAGVAFGW